MLDAGAAGPFEAGHGARAVDPAQTVGAGRIGALLRGVVSAAARIPVGKRPVHIYKIGEKLQIQHAGHEVTELWVSNDSGDSVSVIDSETMKVKATIPVGKGHHKMAFWSDRAYVSNITDGSVSVVSRASLPKSPAQ